MSRDYKVQDRKSGGRRGGGSFLIGLLVGLVLGLAIALGVAWYINKMPNPFTGRPVPQAKSEEKAPKAAPAAKGDEKAAKADEKPRFDFYTILPGTAEKEAPGQPKDAAKGSTAAPKEAFYLQAGAFQSAPDADNLKARLALLGVEAGIQTTTLPDKGVLHRVRVGPYTNVEDLSRTRDMLKRNGIETTLIRLRDTEK